MSAQTLPFNIDPSQAATEPVQPEVPAAEEQPRKRRTSSKPKRGYRVRKISEKVKQRFGATEVGNRVILEVGDNLQIGFPETEIAKFQKELSAIPEISMWHRVPMSDAQPENPENVEWKQIWRVRRSDDTLAKVVAFGRKFKFDFVGDLIMQAQLTTSEAKELEKMSYAKSASNVKLPPLPKWTPREWKKLQLPGPYVKQLKPLKFQPAGYAYALKTKRTFIADEMGLGKTVQALLVLAHDLRVHKSKEPWLIMVPATLKINWLREARKWLGKAPKIGIARNKELKPLINSNKPLSESQKKKALASGKKWLKEHQVVIVNYDRAGKYMPYLKEIKWGGVIFDESHYCKGNSGRTRSVKDLMKHTAPEYRLCLSGTPSMNNPREFIRQLQILDRIDEFGGPTHFLNRYCSISAIDPTALPGLPKPEEDMSAAAQSERQEIADAMIRKHYEALTELNKQLRSTCYIRREKVDVLDSLPEKQRSTTLLDITNRKEYQTAETDLIKFLMDRVDKDEKFLKSIRKLSREEQIQRIKERKAEATYKASRAYALAQIEYCKQVAATGKLDAVTEWIENVIDNGEKLVVFATHQAILDELESRFAKVMVSIRGGDSDEKRQQAVDDFQTNKKVRLFIGSLKAAGVGITLTAASTVAFIELGWNPAIHDQAEDRCHRIGQKNAVNAHYLIAKSTIEERIAKIIERKRMTVDASSVGDPLAKAKLTGTILGDLITDLTKKESLDD